MAAHVNRTMDESRLDRLLAMVSPADGVELLRNLSDDLARLDAALSAAIDCDDRAAIRAETHVLISVAGAVGAFGLSDQARALNQTAHTDALASAEVVQDVVQGLTQLRALIAARRKGGA